MEATISRNFSPRSILATFSFASSATLVAIAISTVTNKLLSVYVGPEGIGLMGLFRNFGSFLGGILTFGYTTILVQQMSRAQDSKEKVVVAYSGFILFLAQMAVAVLLGLFFLDPLTRLLFTAEEAGQYVWEIRLVILMALVNILLQVASAILRGQSDIRGLSAVQIITALSSLALIFPILQWGSLGLAFNVGSGSVVGSVLGVYLVRKNLREHIHWKEWRPAVTHLKQKSVASFLVTLQTILTVGSLLLVQTLIQKLMGLTALGNYNAAFLILDTGVLVMMSSVRSYLLPMLSRCQREEEKVVFFKNFFVTLLSIALAAAIALYLLSPWIIRILFSSKFVGAEKLLVIFSFSLLGLSMVWLYNTLLLHFEKNLAFTVIDCAGAAIFVALSYVALKQGTNLQSVVWAYTAASFITASFYLLYVGRKLGMGYVTLKDKLWPIIGFLALMVAVLSHHSLWVIVALFAVSYQGKILFDQQRLYERS